MPIDPLYDMDEEKYHPNSSGRSRRQLQQLPSIREMFGGQSVHESDVKCDIN